MSEGGTRRREGGEGEEIKNRGHISFGVHIRQVPMTMVRTYLCSVQPMFPTEFLDLIQVLL